MPNTEMIEYWNGENGEYWVQEAERYNRMIGGYGERVLAAIAARSDERILDVGCGTGATTRALAGAAGHAVGLDVSGPMLAEARRRAEAEGIANVEFVQADAQVHPFEPDGFDGVISRFGVMFFEDPNAAFANIATGVKPGGRLAFSCWQPVLRNEWLLVPAAAAFEHLPMPPPADPEQPGPFAFADPERVEGILSAAGFGDVAFEEAVEHMVVGSSVEDALAFFAHTDFAKTIFKDADDETASAAWSSVEAALRAHERGEGVVLKGTGWVVTARRL